MRWIISEPKPETRKLAAEYGISPITAAVLLNRNIKDIRAYLKTSSKNFTDTADIADYKKGIEMLKESLERSDRICIYGDYDVDGVMSTTILYKALKDLGAEVDFYVPHRVYDGYGLNGAAVEKIGAKGCDLLITCDNGIASADDIALAKSLGMKVVILDHHEPVIKNGVQILPNADAVIDCKRNDSKFSFRDMCAGGLCYRFVRDLYIRLGKKFSLERELVTFAGIATVCDIVDLSLDNRIIVKLALYLLENDIRNIGLRYLVDMTVPSGKNITPYTLGFLIGPCINAVGRLEAASEAVELFTTDDPKKAKEYAERLVLKNNERKAITQAAAERLTEQVDLSLPVQVLYDPTIHESVAGIIASRIKDKFYRPTLVITNAENGCKGSGRSVEEYDLFNGMNEFRELFTKFGGHAMAVGFSLPQENINKLREQLNKACTLDPKEMIPSLKLEYKADLSEITLDTAKELHLLEPFGKGNPRPHFYTISARMVCAKLIGADKTIVQLSFITPDERQIRAVFFNGRDTVLSILEKEQSMALTAGSLVKFDIRVDIAYTIDINNYNGNEYLQLLIADMR